MKDFNLEVYVARAELTDEQIKLVHAWCLEAGYDNNVEVSTWLDRDNICNFIGVWCGDTFSVDERDSGCIDLVGFSEFRERIGLPPLKEVTPIRFKDLPQVGETPEMVITSPKETLPEVSPLTSVKTFCKEHNITVSVSSEGYEIFTEVGDHYKCATSEDVYTLAGLLLELSKFEKEG